jgi:hypothetical protein
MRGIIIIIVFMLLASSAAARDLGQWDNQSPEATGHGIIFIGVGGRVYCYVPPGGVWMGDPALSLQTNRNTREIGAISTKHFVCLGINSHLRRLGSFFSRN